MTREADIQELCEAVLNASPDFYDNPNGGYENACPFCREIGYGSNKGAWIHISEIKHSLGCAYLIAKDLSTNSPSTGEQK